MTERCSNCGAELYAGQQFCRRCGAAVRGVSEDAPTQLLPNGAPTAPTPTNTSSFGADTNKVGQSQPTAYHPPLETFRQTSTLDAPPVRKRKRGGWLVALLIVFLLGAGVAGGAGYVWWRAQNRMIVVKKVGNGEMPDIPVPPDLADKIKAKLKEAGVEAGGIPLPLDESGAVVSSDETVLTKTYNIDADATFSIRGVVGDVSVTGIEGDKAEVKIVKHGGSTQEREAVRVLMSQTDKGLSFFSTAGGAVSISYEIQLPRSLHQLEISLETSEVKVNGFDGTVVADVRQGELEFRDVSGTVKSKLIKGNMKVFYEKAEREGAQEFSVVRGNIEATFADGVSADLKAETIDGDISADDKLGLKVEKRPAGSKVVGRLGDGGSESLLFKVTNGDIKLKK